MHDNLGPADDAGTVGREFRQLEVSVPVYHEQTVAVEQQTRVVEEIVFEDAAFIHLFCTIFTMPAKGKFVNL